VLAALLLGAASPGSPDQAIAVGAPPTTEAAALSPAQSALVAWAQARFAGAGLDVPSVGVVFDPEADQCGGFQGRYYAETSTVYMCLRNQTSERVLRTLLLHEMAHAWTEEQLTDVARAEFAELRETPTWGSWEFTWTERATEHAAVVLAWGLMDVTTNVEPIGDTSPGSLHEAFRFLTGRDPINDGSAPSDQPTRLPHPAVRLA
jgi:hypothetical protein